MAGGAPWCLGWAMTPAALLISSSHATATPPSLALDLTGGSPNLDLGRGLCWERKGFGDQGCPPTPASPQASVLALPLPGCRRSKPLPFTSLGFFLCGVRPAGGGRQNVALPGGPRGGGGHRRAGGVGGGEESAGPTMGEGNAAGPPVPPTGRSGGRLSLGLRLEPGWESRCQTRGQGQRSSGRPSAAGGTGRGRRDGGAGRRLHPRLPRPLTQPGQVPLPLPVATPWRGLQLHLPPHPYGHRSRPVSASLPPFLSARKPARAPPPTRGQRYN